MKYTPVHQRGAILIVTLVMLLLMTLLALSSMSGTTLQERMAGNLRDESLAFQSAEMAQREAEAAARIKSIAAWQNTAITEVRTNADTLANQGQAQYRMNPLPGVTIREKGGSLEAGTAVTTSVIRIESWGAGAMRDKTDKALATSATVNLNTLYIRR